LQNFQVLVLRIAKGTDVEVHSGPANNILNVHMGISGLEGAVLGIANKTYGWEEGKVIAWDGSYDHLVECKNCEAEWRTIMMVRYMHPDITKEDYRGNERTHFEEVPKDWFPTVRVLKDGQKCSGDGAEKKGDKGGSAEGKPAVKEEL
jgi:hypothetical protein